MLSILGDETEVGIYGVAFTVTKYSDDLRNLVAMAFFPVLVKYFNRNKSPSLIIKYSLMLFFSSLVVASIISYFSSEIIITIFSEEYRKSSNVFRILIFYSCLTWTTLPFTTAAQAIGKEFLFMKILIFMGIGNVIGNYIFYINYGMIGIAYSTLIVHSVGTFAQCFFIHRAISQNN